MHITALLSPKQRVTVRYVTMTSSRSGRASAVPCRVRQTPARVEPPPHENTTEALRSGFQESSQNEHHTREIRRRESQQPQKLLVLRADSPLRCARKLHQLERITRHLPETAESRHIAVERYTVRRQHWPLESSLQVMTRHTPQPHSDFVV